jgi:hypothetical protein
VKINLTFQLHLGFYCSDFPENCFFTLQAYMLQRRKFGCDRYIIKWNLFVDHFSFSIYLIFHCADFPENSCLSMYSPYRPYNFGCDRLVVTREEEKTNFREFTTREKLTPALNYIVFLRNVFYILLVRLWRKISSSNGNNVDYMNWPGCAIHFRYWRQ